MLVREVAGRATRTSRLPEAAELPLSERAKRDHVARVARADRRRRELERRGHVVAAAAPGLRGPGERAYAQCGGEPERIVALIHVRDEAIDLGRREARVRACVA